eukprot:3905589-Amphidinium_carterae.1
MHTDALENIVFLLFEWAFIVRVRAIVASSASSCQGGNSFFKGKGPADCPRSCFLKVGRAEVNCWDEEKLIQIASCAWEHKKGNSIDGIKSHALSSNMTWSQETFDSRLEAFSNVGHAASA